MKYTLGALLFSLVLIAGCATNPVTGDRELQLVSRTQELEIGRQQYQPTSQMFGGDYTADPDLGPYVQEVGGKLAAVSDRQLPYEFRVLNDSSPNAWALPGGKIAVNRGLLTELNNEAELAAVLGHEIVHAAARHSAQAMERAMLIQGAVAAAAIASQQSDFAPLVAMGANLGAQLVTQRYSRAAELEADRYGMEYMARAGYDPEAAVTLQETFLRLAGERQSNWLEGLFASHPPSRERVVANEQTALTLPADGELGKQRYEDRLAYLRSKEEAYRAADQAHAALQDGRLDEAHRLASRAAEIEPREASFQGLLGDIALARSQPETAIGHYDKAIAAKGELFAHYLGRGIAYQQLDRNGPAEADLRRSVELLPTAPALQALGDINAESGRTGQAKTYYGQAAAVGGAAGRRALASLVRLDVGDNPESYLKLRFGLDGNQQLLVEVGNPTPVAVSDLVIQIDWVDRNGRRRQDTRRLDGRLEAEQSRRWATGLGPVARDDGRPLAEVHLRGARPR